MQLEFDIVDDDPASRTERLLLQRGLDTKDSSDWSGCVEEEWEYLKIKDWLETNPDADDMAVINKILEICVLPDLRKRPDGRLDIGSEMTEAEESTSHEPESGWLE